MSAVFYATITGEHWVLLQVVSLLRFERSKHQHWQAKDLGNCWDKKRELRFLSQRSRKSAVDVCEQLRGHGQCSERMPNGRQA